MINPEETLDVRNKVCPMPALLTRKKLEQIESGKVLEVIGDFPTAKDNIQRLVKQQGHEVMNVVQEKSQFHIFIKKK